MPALTGGRRLLALPNRNATARGGGGRTDPETGFLCSFPWGSRRPTSSNLQPPGPPPFISSFIPACLSGVGLKGDAHRKRHLNQDYPKPGNKREGEYGCCLDLFVSRYTSEIAKIAELLLLRKTLAKLRIAPLRFIGCHSRRAAL